MLTQTFTAFVAFSSAFAVVTAHSTPSLPIVDLGYELHQAIAYNATGGYYNFTNIRYAAPPTGSLRFKAPADPVTNRSEVQTGEGPRFCPQALPGWYSLRTWVTEYLNGQPITVTQADFDDLLASRTLSNVTGQPVGASEDCLFLDVMVPQSIFDKANTTGSSYGYKGAPIIMWISGGAHVWGGKNSLALSGDPAGLLANSLTKDREGVIYVAINHRLGALGFSNGPSFTQGGGTPNAGLLDQRFALEWIQKNIHLFGGDPSRVTVWGHGSGAADVMYQITAYGGQKPVPFARANIEAPGIRNQFDTKVTESIYQRLLDLTNTTCFEELQCLPADILIAANTLQIFQSEFDQNTYFPAYDGDFIVATLPRALATGKFAKNVDVMVSHDINDALQFIPILDLVNANYTEAGITTFIDGTFPQASRKVKDYMQNTLYPSCYTGEYGYTDIVGRLNTFVAEASFTCNKYFLSQAFNGKDYALYNSIYPAEQLALLPYAYYNGGGVDAGVLNVTNAVVYQGWITTFAQNGVPTTPDVRGIPKFPKWGSKGMSMDFNLTSIMPTVDPTNNARCAWWQKGLYQ